MAWKCLGILLQVENNLWNINMALINDSCDRVVKPNWTENKSNFSFRKKIIFKLTKIPTFEINLSYYYVEFVVILYLILFNVCVWGCVCVCVFSLWTAWRWLPRLARSVTPPRSWVASATVTWGKKDGCITNRSTLRRARWDRIITGEMYPALKQYR